MIFAVAKYLVGVTYLVVFLFGFSTLAHAHLMVEQHGTLKWGKGGYYFVLSVPVSALSGVDDDGDGLLSNKEFRTHYNLITTSVEKGYSLESHTLGPSEIAGLLMNVSHLHNNANKPATHIVAMGRFNVPENVTDLVLKTTLFGKRDSEKQFKLKITRGQEQENFILSNTNPSHNLFGANR